MAKKRKKRNTKNKNLFWSRLIASSFFLFAIYVLFFHTETISTSTVQGGLRTVEKNYGEDIERYAKDFNISPSYLKALAMLETSGRKNLPQRFEQHVFDKLKEVQNGKRRRYERVRQKNLQNMSDGAIRNLASSWGPFQIMGYKCYELGITVHELRGDKAVYYGIKWIDINYGKLLRKGNYRDAFHYHNTGRNHPIIGKAETYDPDYVTNGLKYMEYFESKKSLY